MSADPSSILGFGLFATYCTVTLPMPDGSVRTLTTVQPTFGIATDPRTGQTLPSVASGRQLLGGAIVCRLSTERGPSMSEIVADRAPKLRNCPQVSMRN